MGDPENEVAIEQITFLLITQPFKQKTFQLYIRLSKSRVGSCSNLAIESNEQLSFRLFSYLVYDLSKSQNLAFEWQRG